MKRVCVVTGSRADYGLLRWVMQGINESDKLELQLIATGNHLSPSSGLTVNEITNDGFRIDWTIPLAYGSFSSKAVTESLAQAIAGFAEAFSVLRPDLVFLLGDRYEIWGAGAAATIARIPIAHAHGGETTEGAFDEVIRHGLTKMSHVHFVAAEEFRARVLQLGESPHRVFRVGALGLDNLIKLSLLDRDQLQQAIGAELGGRNLLVTYHPVTLEDGSAGAQARELLDALEHFPDTHLFFTMPNADPESQEVVSAIEDFVRDRPHAHYFPSIGQLLYLSLMKHVDAVVGNSSSGIIEAPAVGIPTVNIGTRQHGRPRASSVIDCGNDSEEIVSALRCVYSMHASGGDSAASNPYGSPGASAAVVRILEELQLDGILRKHFEST